MTTKGEVKERGWERVQIKAFTAWLNQILEKRNLRVNDIKTDLGTGVLLINFLELLSGKKIHQKYDLKPPSRIQSIQNLHIALTFLEKVLEIKPTSSAEDFADQNLKMILGFLWSMFKKYRIATIKQDDKSSEEGLLLWVKKQTEGYKDVSIESYKSSFKDGLAFDALCDKFIDNKDVFNFNKFNKNNANENLTAAFETAEKHLGIPKLLEASEVSEGTVDERSLVLYVSLYFHAFVAKQQQLALQAEKDQVEQRMKGLQGSLEQRAKLAEDLQIDNTKLRSEMEDMKNQQKAELDARDAKIGELLSQVVDWTNKYEEEKAARLKDKEEYEQRSKVEIQGLDVLKKNLEEHIEDLFRWQKYLDLDSTTEVDFSGEIRPQIIRDISKQNWNSQLEYLSKKLEKENSDLLSMLRIKETEQKEKKDKEKKKIL